MHILINTSLQRGACRAEEVRTASAVCYIAITRNCWSSS